MLSPRDLRRQSEASFEESQFGSVISIVVLPSIQHVFHLNVFRVSRVTALSHELGILEAVSGWHRPVSSPAPRRQDLVSETR